MLYIYIYIYNIYKAKPGRVVIVSLNCKKLERNDQKPPFCIQQFLFSSCLFKLTAASPLTNSCPNQKDAEWQHSLFLCHFLPVLICMWIFTLCGFTWLPAWRYVTICDIISLGAAMFFPVKKINLARGAYALTFALRWVTIFIPIDITNTHPNWYYQHSSSRAFSIFVPLLYTVCSRNIIMMLCHQHGYPWPSPTPLPYRSLLLVGYIPYPHRAAVCRFELVDLLLLGHMRGP